VSVSRLNELSPGEQAADPVSTGHNLSHTNKDVLAIDNYARAMMRLALIVAALLTSCSRSPTYYPQAGKTNEDLQKDYLACQDNAKTMPNTGTTFCMRAKGWVEVGN